MVGTAVSRPELMVPAAGKEHSSPHLESTTAFNSQAEFGLQIPVFLFTIFFKTE